MPVVSITALLARPPRARRRAATGRSGVLVGTGTTCVLLLVLGVVAPVQAVPGRGRTAPAAAALAGVPLSDRAMFGAHVEGMYDDPALLAEFEDTIGRRTDVASYYYGYAGNGEGAVFPGTKELAFADGGRREVLVAWDMGPTRFAEWTAGRHDHYLDRIAAAARDYPYDVHVRPWAEMNGDWASYQPTRAGDRPNGGTYRQFKQAWRYVVTYLRDRGADNLRWVFNAAAETYAATTPVERIWPGTRYVDVLGLDGFNWGKDDAWGTWRSFRTIFRDQYRRLTALHPRAPVWICETGSKEPAVDDGAPVDPTRDKAKWIREAFAQTGMSRIAAVVWFEERKERDWRLESSAGSLRAVRSVFEAR